MHFKLKVRIFIAVLLVLELCSAQYDDTTVGDPAADTPAPDTPVEASPDYAAPAEGDAATGDSPPAGGDEPVAEDTSASPELTADQPDNPMPLGAAPPGEASPDQKKSAAPTVSKSKPSSKGGRKQQDFAKSFWKGSKKLGKLTSSSKKPKSSKVSTTKRPRRIFVSGGGGSPNVQIKFSSNRKAKPKQNNASFSNKRHRTAQKSNTTTLSPQQ